MVAVLDQYEVEYKETYTSGTYDQVVMGKMFYPVTQRGETRYVYGNRGVVYGSINSNQAPTPGTGVFDFSNSFSYRLQPYREKAGNVKAAKHTCDQERIYDTLAPNPISCFNVNGASTFLIASGSPAIFPGQTPTTTGVDTLSHAFIMFDNFTPTENSNAKKNINPGVDRHWTKSFPFEPRYNGIKREKLQNFSSIESSYTARFVALAPFVTTPVFTLQKTKIKKSGLIVGTVGHAIVAKHLISTTGSYDPSASGSFYHRWAVDVDLGRTFTNGFSTVTATGSCGHTDLIKVLFGFGDINTTYFDSQLSSSNDPTGYARFGTNNWPDFRKQNATNIMRTGIGAPIIAATYEKASGSYWTIGPVIRGWKYGLYNGLPDYTSAYFRQGKYGQYRDMLEQRIYTKFLSEDQNLSLTSKNNVDDGPITIKFVDPENNLTDPVRTQSQNLSVFATSSLPYFDLQQRNRPNVTPLTNLALVDFKLDRLGNITV